MKIKYKLFLLLGIIIMISVVSIANIISPVPSKYRKIGISSAKMKNLTQTVTVEGVVSPEKKQVIDINSIHKVLEEFVIEGQDVKKGDLILRLDNSEDMHRLNIEEINLNLAERELSKLLRNEEADKKNVENSYEQAQLALNAAKVDLDTSLSLLTSDELLLESGAISKIQFEDSQKNVRNKEYELAVKTMELDRLSQSLKNFSLVKDDKIFELQSNINLIKENIDYLNSKVDAVTRADIDGKVVKLDIKDMYSAQESGQVLIYDMSKYVVNAQLKQQEAIYIEEGMKAKIIVKGMEEKIYKGIVLEVDEIATSYLNGGSTPMLDVRISIDDPDEAIRMGYKAEVKIDLNIKQGAVVVDFESIIQDLDGKKYIYFVENDIARRRGVSTGIETNFEVEITEGIIQGDRYVVNPPEKMQSKNSMKIWGWRYESR